MTWIDSAHCRTRAHCSACRNDRAFRQSIVRAGMAAEVDFACPFGATADMPAPPGPGTCLKGLLAWAGIRALRGCSCEGHAAEMDRQGPAWCEANMATIVGWLQEEAGKRRLPFSAWAAAHLVRLAIRKSLKRGLPRS